MNNFYKNVMGGFFIAFYLMCFAFPVGLVSNMFNEHLPIGQFLVNEVIIFFVVWFAGYLCSEFYRDMLARANKPRSEDDMDKRKHDDQNLNAGKKDKDGIDHSGEDHQEK